MGFVRYSIMYSIGYRVFNKVYMAYSIKYYLGYPILDY